VGNGRSRTCRGGSLRHDFVQFSHGVQVRLAIVDFSLGTNADVPGPRVSIARSDWPGPGPIDLSVHDLPHPACGVEWWYVKAHFVTVTGRNLSVFAAFFRNTIGVDETTKSPIDSYAVTWSVIDVESGAYYPESRVDKVTPKLGLERIKNNGGSKDPRLNRALTEVLERGRVPVPDRMFDGDVHIAADRLELDFSGARFEKQEDQTYRLRLQNARSGSGCDLTFAPEKPVQRHGDEGIVGGPSGESMFYYFIPRCALSGEVTVRGTVESIAGGDGWYDHEFGAHAESQGKDVAARTPDPTRITAAWNWTAMQLDDGTDITVSVMVDATDGSLLNRWAIIVDPAGKRTAYDDFAFEPGEEWRSTRTFNLYPTQWTLSIPAAQLLLNIRASFQDQEFITVISRPAFWEGRCEVEGTFGAAKAAGIAFIERRGFDAIHDLDDFFSAVGKEVRKSVAEVIPLEPTEEQAIALIASDARPHYLEGVDLGVLANSLFKPIREIIDRGGKSWRSYAAMACCDVVGGDSRKFVQWLAVPELLHVGSLIVDDVQDRSSVRRGGPACHLIYGEPIAINAGTACYFLGQNLFKSVKVSDAAKLKLYDLYFEGMRGGHAGQALDLAGLEDIMPQVVESGDSTVAEQRILAVHRLKAAAPAAALSRMGAIIGGGSDEQIEAVGGFFEALGLAFQIIDDVLNLRGFTADLKSRGEDLSNGTVTFPVAKAMGMLPDKDHRMRIWKTVRSKPTEAAVVKDVIDSLEACGAIQACVDQAGELVENAWTKAEPLLEDSLSKLMLRAFGWYVLERHY
jgi:geranylgeranyl pyrophosphate synthase/predicted secreted hydrolase